MNDLKPDVLFLDIEMPKGDGFQVISGLVHEPVIIFTTAFDEYAIEAFNIHALDYLLKPFSKERFRQSVELIRKLVHHPQEHNRRMRDAIPDLKSRQEYLNRVTVKNKYVFKVLPASEITSIKTSGGLVFLSSGGENYQSDTTLGQFEEHLDPKNFMRIHRTAIINLERITKVMPWGQGRLAVVMDDGESLQVSRERMKAFKEKIGLRF